VSNQLENARLQRAKATWPVYRLKHLARVTGGGTPSKDNAAFWESGNIPWASPKDMKRRTITETEDYITEDAVDGSATSFVEADSPLMVVRSGILRNTLPIAIAGRRLTLNQDMKAFKLSPRLDPHFFVYWIEGQTDDLLLEWRQLGATVESIDVDRMMNGKIAFPDLTTQRSIAKFLDRETARIDQLIEKRENFLALVDEKKTALKALAVNGSILDGTAGGERGWFGVLPAGWRVCRGKFLFRERDTRSVTGEEELLTVSHITGVTSRAEKDVNMFLAESMEGYKLVFEGDIAVNTMWAWMGALGMSPLDGLISPSYGVYAPIGNHFTFQYLDLLLRSRPLVAEINRRSKGVWSSRLRLYPDAFLDIPFPVPEIDVQNRILAALDSATERENKLAAASLKSIDRLREFRSALITAAVTGQIDVETWGRSGETDRRTDRIEEEMVALRAAKEVEERA
jgi:type I restriction enzyme S subunit